MALIKGDNLTTIRDCEGILIPSAEKIIIEKNADIIVYQDLGKNLTAYFNGNLVRINGNDLDAFGIENRVHQPADIEKKHIDGFVNKESVQEALKTCYDPEIPVNIVDLGLIYKCIVIDNDDKGSNVFIEMTLTAPTCSMGPVLVNDVKNTLSHLDNVTGVRVDLVFEPQWDMSKMSEAAKLKMGLL